MTINSITITGAIFILNFALSQGKSLGSGPLSVRVASLATLFAAFLVVLAWINWRGLVLIDRHTYKRIREIEKTLGMQGHSAIFRELSGSRLYKARFWLGDLFYAIVFSASMGATFFLSLT